MSETAVVAWVAIAVGYLGCYAIGHMMGWRVGYRECMVEARQKIRQLEDELKETEGEDWRGE